MGVSSRTAAIAMSYGVGMTVIVAHFEARGPPADRGGRRALRSLAGCGRASDSLTGRSRARVLGSPGRPCRSPSRTSCRRESSPPSGARSRRCAWRRSSSSRPTLAVDDLYGRLGTRASGLTADEAAARLAEHGPNVVATDARKGILDLLAHAVVNPLVILLAVLTIVSFATGDARAGTVMSLDDRPERRPADSCRRARPTARRRKLKAMISVTATVVRDGRAEDVPVAPARARATSCSSPRAT